MTAAPRHVAQPRAPIPAGAPARAAGHIRELDGVRAVAVLAVFTSHVGWGPLTGGWIGVGVFFTLSGYLITSILIREWQVHGTVGLRRFYGKRLLRLYPALLVMLLLCAFFAPLFGDGGTAGGYVTTAINSGLYVENLVFGLAHDPHGGLMHTWSLAAEEQFYLIWPPVLIMVLHCWSAARWRRGSPPGTATTCSPGCTRPSARPWYRVRCWCWAYSW